LILDALALLGLSAILPGFTLDGFWAAFGLAVVLGLANALVWPLLLRIALPFTVATLGLGALVLNGALLLLSAAIIEEVHVNDLFSAVVLIVRLTLITSIVRRL